MIFIKKKKNYFYSYIIISFLYYNYFMVIFALIDFHYVNDNYYCRDIFWKTSCGIISVSYIFLLQK
jgi:hypothetical protein